MSGNASLYVTVLPLLTLKKDDSLFIDVRLTPNAYVVSHLNFYNQGIYGVDRNNTLVLLHLSKSMKVTIRFISYELGTNSRCQNESTRDVLSIYSDNNTDPLFKCGDTNATPQPLVYNNPNFNSLRLHFVSDSSEVRHGGFLLQYLGELS